MNLYAVTAVVNVSTGGATITRQVPTFYLDADVQGFADETGAERVAREIILSSRLNGPVDRTGITGAERAADVTTCRVHVTATQLGGLDR